MNPRFVLITLLFLGISFSAQEKQQSDAHKDSTEVFSIVENMPVFGNGQSDMTKYLVENLSFRNIPDSVTKSKVFIKFIVRQTGKVDSVQVLKSIPPCPACEKEAMRVISAMPDWKPGKMGGRPVNVFYNLPIVFNRQ